MIYHVELIYLTGERTDSSTRSFYQAARRREEMNRRGYVAQVVTGSGRLVIDALGGERR